MANTIFTSAAGEIYFASLNILVIMLMLILSVRLLFSRQKRAYLSLSVCMAVMLLGQIALLGAGFMEAGGRGLTIAHNILNSMSFILANMGAFQLYAATTRRVMITAYVLLSFAVILSFMPVASALYSILLVGFAFLIVRPVMEEGGTKYQVGIAFYAIATIAHVVSVFATNVAGIAAVDNLFRIAFFMVLFLIMFDKVLTLMESSYNKSTRDALTGLYNRFYFYTAVSFQVNDKRPISVIFFDLDNFKKLNDTRGHGEGDNALKAVASILKEEAEEVGIAGRYGGEEMVMLIDDPDVNVATLAEHIRSRIEDETVVTASIGFATLADGVTTDMLIKNADKAMYVSKKSGKNRALGFENLTEEQLALLAS
ncbi:sensor domain-containing diguanylate cyclase [Cohnella soli]|uniref:Diguanylate cyclase n=1 Tax=Cohnella soli TaxID=425005 RepID=A0ABW0HQB9_9BACL